MDALVFRYSSLRYLMSRATYGLSRHLWSARYAPLAYTPLPEPAPRRSGWTVLRVLLSGICGSDLQMVTGQDSLDLTPEATYPFVPGHELVGRVERAACGERDGLPIEFATGERVAVWPVLGCAARSQFHLCFACSGGWEGQCECRTDDWPGRGIAIGFNRETGGGWSERCLAHVSQLWRLPDCVSDADAVLLDPAATAMASLLRTNDSTLTRTLVIGGGTVALLAAYLHSRLRLPGQCETPCPARVSAGMGARTRAHSHADQRPSEFFHVGVGSVHSMHLGQWLRSHLPRGL